MAIRRDMGTSADQALGAARSRVSVLDAIRERRAVRAYTPRQVEADVVRALIDAAIWAPSAENQQPWAFVVLQDKAFLQRISDRAKELTLARLEPGSPLWEHREILTDPDYCVFYDASTVVAICAAPGSWPPNEDCCLAAQNLMLAAHAMGLATCPIGFAREALNEPRTKAELGIPGDHEVVMPIVVGYPRERPAPTERRAPRILSWK